MAVTCEFQIKVGELFPVDFQSAGLFIAVLFVHDDDIHQSHSRWRISGLRITDSGLSFLRLNFDRIDFQLEWSSFFVTEQDAHPADLSWVKRLILYDSPEPSGDKLVDGQFDLDPFVLLSLKVGSVRESSHWSGNVQVEVVLPAVASDSGNQRVSRLELQLRRTGSD